MQIDMLKYKERTMGKRLIFAIDERVALSVFHGRNLNNK